MVRCNPADRTAEGVLPVEFGPPAAPPGTPPDGAPGLGLARLLYTALQLPKRWGPACVEGLLSFLTGMLHVWIVLSQLPVTTLL